MNVEMLPTETLLPHARNVKRHDEAHVAQIVASIREFGFTQPVLVDGTNTIVAGHGRQRDGGGEQ